MAKRFTDTNKWKKPFIKSLTTVNKLLWYYITDDCDHAGIWHIEFDIAEVRIGEKINHKSAKIQFENHIYEFDNSTKWFIPDFISFQYGELNPNVKAHNSVIKILTSYNLIDSKLNIKQLSNSSITVKDMDKDMEEDMDKDKDKDQIIFPFDSDEFKEVWDLWMKFRAENKWIKYKKIGMQAALNKLSEISNGNEQEAIKIINNSIANSYRGFFEIKESKNKDGFTETNKILRQIEEHNASKTAK